MTAVLGGSGKAADVERFPSYLGQFLENLDYLRDEEE